MRVVTSVIKDHVCGMTVERATAVHAERNGKRFSFCGEHCRGKFLSTSAGAKPKDKSAGEICDFVSGCTRVFLLSDRTTDSPRDRRTEGLNP